MRAAVLLVPVLVATSAAAQIQLVKDLNTQPDANPSSYPRELLAVGDLVYFTADRLGVGRELFHTKGSAATTVVRDVRPGRQGSEPESLTELGGAVYFSADDGATGRELWKTDGTAAGTVRVIDLRGGAAGSDPQSLVAFQGALLFTAVDASGTRRLFRTDGTAAGTVKVYDSAAGWLHRAGAYVWWTEYGRAVWRTDGTTAGTVRVFATQSDTTIYRVFAVGAKYLFGGCLGATGAALFVSDGTPQGTSRLSTLPVRPYCSLNPPHLYGVHLGRLWFQLATSAEGREMWTSDGTAAGTKLLRDIVPGSSGSLPSAPVRLGGKVYFAAALGLWRTDGTATGTTKVATLPTYHGELVPAGDRAWFTRGTVAGTELWQVDGTVQGTKSIGIIRSGLASATGYEFVQRTGGKVLFRFDDPTHGVELWATDGTLKGTGLAVDVNPGPVTKSSNPRVLGAVAGRVLLVANDGVHGSELWRTDGTAAGTQMVKELVPGANSDGPWNPLVHDDRLYFQAPVGGVDQLHVSDGTAAGTRSLTSLRHGVATSRCLHANRIYFTSITPSGLQLWTYATRTGQATLLHTFARTYDWGLRLTPVDGQVFFIGHDKHDYEPWKTDGTPQGTAMIEDTYAPATTTRIDHVVAWRGRFYFGGPSSNGSSNVLWVSDGTPAGTEPLGAVSLPREFCATEDRLWFTSVGGLYHTDGTHAGTLRVQAGFDSARQPIPFGAGVLFPAWMSTKGVEIWFSDGTSAGTRLVHDVVPGPGGTASNLVAVGSRRAYFATTDPRAGFELFVTDGTASGTRLVEDLNPGGAPGYGSGMTLAGGQLYLSAQNGTTGMELFRFDPGGTARTLGQHCGASRARLWSSDPVLGASTVIAGKNGPAPSQGVLVLGYGPAVPLLDCLSSIRLPVALVPVAAPSWTLKFHNPSDPRTSGFRILGQTWYLTSSAPRGFELSNAVEMTLGR